ncbi:ribosome biogenesis factor YjgA [Denitratisoma sp. DHT3]|uniref:ribosome biogenesis factor YjgA n=1 Tax=Denitratisoma sp. DHT3 TaxID=1981880 RepID=UPI0021BD4388|nr:ribosome biogenesis factor YjgA [Denitratisoma sp. DHT3]
METFDTDPERPSKSQKKREMNALQDLGEALVALSTDQLKKIDLPDDLRAAVRDAQRFGSHGARRRQMQYIGKLMRAVEPAPIQAALDEINGVSAAANARLHGLERQRQRLLENENVIGEIAREYPGTDIQYLRQLRRNALKEQELGKPPRAFREIFQVLKNLVDAGAADTPDVMTEEREDTYD